MDRESTVLPPPPPPTGIQSRVGCRKNQFTTKVLIKGWLDGNFYFRTFQVTFFTDAVCHGIELIVQMNMDETPGTISVITLTIKKSEEKTVPST